MLSQLKNLDYKAHLLASFVIRLVLIAYGVCHDKLSDVPYTDIDYKVFTDAARHVLHAKSPYGRHTYRYSPIIALLMTPNVRLHPIFGKVLFSFVDILVGLLIRTLVKSCIEKYECYEKYNDTNQTQNSSKKTIEGKKNKKNKKKLILKIVKTNAESWADNSMLVWLYNPMTLAISTRGNSDSIACLLVLLTLYFLEHKKWYFEAGLVHGLCIHFRLYPIIFSLAYYMHLSKFSQFSPSDQTLENIDLNASKSNDQNKQTKKENTKLTKFKADNKILNKLVLTSKNTCAVLQNKKEHRTIFRLQYLMYLVPNLQQSLLVYGTVFSLGSLTGIFYYLYGYKFVFETYIYHFVRTDPKHNFSLYFYLQYLSAWVKHIGIWQKTLTVLPQIVLLIVFSIRYGLYKLCLNFAVLVLTIVMVIYNGVLTSQYFVWIAGILPLCLWQINISKKAVALLIGLWFLAQGAWLLPAYLLEFKGRNTFIFIWVQGVAFFCVNSIILGRLIMYFMPVKDLRKSV